MYSKKRTLADKFSLTNRKIDLPRDAVIDRIFTLFTVTVHNSHATTAYSGKLADILNKITDMRIVSDGNNVHYSLNALDLAIINYMDSMGKAINPDDAITVAAASDATFTFILCHDQGDILALVKESLEYSFNVNTTIDTDNAITALTGLVTLEENILTSAEFTARFGANLEAAAEPKIVALEKAFNVSEELSEFFSLPTGTLSRRAFMISYDGSGVRGGVSPSKIGIIVTTPDRRELFTVDYPTLKEINRRSYLCTPLIGVTVIDYADELTNDEYGLKGWKYTKDDYQLAAKSASAGKIRYISCEFVVNTTHFDATAAAEVEVTE